MPSLWWGIGTDVIEMKHISGIIAENRKEALQAGKCYEKKCDHCGFPIWTVDEKELNENHIMTINFRDIHKKAILCNSCLSNVNDMMNEED